MSVKAESEGTNMGRIATFYDHIQDIAREEQISVTEAMQAAKELGVCALEISQNNLVGREDEVGRELAKAGLGVSSVPAYFDFGRNQDVPAQSQNVLEAAASIGADKILVIPGFLDENASAKERERVTAAMIDCIRRLAELAASYHISLVMEDFDSDRAVFAKTAEVRRFVESCPGLSCCFDTGNFRYSAEDELLAYEALKHKIGHVHLKDRAYTPDFGPNGPVAADGKTLYPCPVGAGEIAIEPLLSKLEQDGYTGLYTVEHYGATPMLPCLRQSVAWVKERIDS